MPNPLTTPGEVFDLDLSNPNPTSSKTKDGPIYRISFEVQRDLWDLFMEADTKGLLIAAKACVYDGTAETEPAPKSAKGPWGEASAILYESGWFSAREVREAIGGDAAYLDWVRSMPCCVRGWYVSRVVGTEIRGPRHGGRIEAAHVRRIKEGSGTGIKPEYSAVPLCSECHSRQHVRGESAIGGKDFLDKQAQEHLTKWVVEGIKERLGVMSLTDASPADLCTLATKLGVYSTLPAKYRALVVI